MEGARMKRQLGAACCYAYARLTLNYYMYYEAAQDADFPRGILDPLSGRFHGILGDFLGGIPSSKALEELRTEVIREMERATAYTDSLQAYEYVLNRMEGRFEPKLMGGERRALDSEAAAREIMAYIRDGGEAPLVNQRIQNVVGQLPVRLTKNKFFAMVEEGLSVYLKGTQENLDDMMNILRSEGLLNQPKDCAEGYERLHGFLEMCRGADYARMDAQTYRGLTEQLKEAGDTLSGLTWNILLLMNLVNDLYLIFLTRERVLMGVSEETRMKEILRGIKAMFDAGAGEIPGELTQSLTFLEGKQEAYFEQWMRGQESAGEIRAGDEPLGELLYQVETLMSGSSFMELVPSENREMPVTREALAQEEERLFDSLRESWKHQPKVLVRAVMAKILSRLPVFFHSSDELFSYIENSLEACEDEAEREASVRLIRMIRDEEME